jgi:hypothetical protein
MMQLLGKQVDLPARDGADIFTIPECPLPIRGPDHASSNESKRLGRMLASNPRRPPQWDASVVLCYPAPRWLELVVPLPLYSCVIVPARPGFIGTPGWVRSRAWIWLFSSTERATAWGGRIDMETDHIPELVGELRIVRQFERPDTVRRELVGLEDALHRPQADPCRLGQHPSRPMSGFSRRRPGHEVDNLLDGRDRRRWLARFARLVAQQPSTPSSINRACQRHTTGLGLPDPRMISAVPQLSAVARMIWARHTCFCGAQGVATNALSRRRSRADVDDNSCSHDESLNCFRRFGNRPNESDHQHIGCKRVARIGIGTTHPRNGVRDHARKYATNGSK